ncbi:GNAT family N-acetyltransferase [Piscinibacter sp. XHJ-5]|uniref:GNAT family N-acetyltransferase n=1 Tax=Piscinibacter sp. XHJ-5 TaxID=3037797 RepID=UPI002452B677|nr:GNAT family N-acetyltransferase [Piscinibacter sp. XHJ-5]
MDAPQPGYFWKVPFIWEAGCRQPEEIPSLDFEPIEQCWLEWALSEVRSHSVDESDAYAVAKHGANGAALDLLAVCPQYFERPSGWWQCAVSSTGDRVGFTLPVLFKDPSRFQKGRPQGTIFYMGVLPDHRGRGFGWALLEHATRMFIDANCWRIFCDTSSKNEPMIRAFRKAGYLERKPWQRPLE